MIRLLLVLSLSLFAVMMIWGGEADTQPEAHVQAARAIERPALAATPVAFTAPEGSLAPTVLPLVRPATSAQAPEVAAETITIRYITAQSVNVREGPSTEFPVIGKLSRGEAARLLWTETNGWAHITLEGDGITGFISGEFLSDSAP